MMIVREIDWELKRQKKKNDFNCMVGDETALSYVVDLDARRCK
jgi:hypothetical protein